MLFKLTWEERTYWKCNDNECWGWAVTVSEELQVTKDHSRFPDSALIEAKKGYRRVKFFQATSKGSDQTAHMRWLICGFAGRTYHIEIIKT